MNNIISQLKKPFLCISSVIVKEDGFKDYRFAAYKAATEVGFYVKRNPEDIGSTQDSFEYALKNEYPVFILIAGEEDSDNVRNECNIALKKCLPLLIFIKESNNGGISRKTQDFIESLSKMSYDKSCSIFENAEDLYNQTKERLTNFLNNKNSSYPLLNSDVGSAYNYCANLFENTKTRILMYQKTSSLILGPRIGIDYEYNFYNSLINWIRNKQPEMQFIHVFSKRDTLNEIKKHNKDYSISEAKENLINLYKQCKDDRNFVVRINNVANDVSYVISDANMVLVFPIETLRYSITLPFYLMKDSEISKIGTALSSRGSFLIYDEIDNFYK